jgi:hypothetical protein
MMTNTLIVNADQAVKAYRSCMMEHLYADMDYLHPTEFAGDLKQLAQDLLAFDSGVNSLATFRNHFRNGSTMMFLDDKSFDQLETWHNEGAEFRIALFKEDGSPVGIVEQKDITW